MTKELDDQIKENMNELMLDDAQRQEVVDAANEVIEIANQLAQRRADRRAPELPGGFAQMNVIALALGLAANQIFKEEAAEEAVTNMAYSRFHIAKVLISRGKLAPPVRVDADGNSSPWSVH